MTASSDRPNPRLAKGEPRPLLGSPDRPNGNGPVPANRAVFAYAAARGPQARRTLFAKDTSMIATSTLPLPLPAQDTADSGRIRFGAGVRLPVRRTA